MQNRPGAARRKRSVWSGFVGFYQLNVEIPVGAQLGPGVLLVLVLHQNSVLSNTVTVAMR